MQECTLTSLNIKGAYVEEKRCYTRGCDGKFDRVSMIVWFSDRQYVIMKKEERTLHTENSYDHGL